MDFQISMLIVFLARAEMPALGSEKNKFRSEFLLVDIGKFSSQWSHSLSRTKCLRARCWEEHMYELGFRSALALRKQKIITDVCKFLLS